METISIHHTAITVIHTPIGIDPDKSLSEGFVSTIYAKIILRGELVGGVLQGVRFGYQVGSLGGFGFPPQSISKTYTKQRIDRNVSR